VLKRSFDVVLAFIGLVILSPVLIIIAAIIVISDPGPIFYRGPRVGRSFRPFRIYKFRTMVVDADKAGASSTAGDDPRITRVGTFLRRYKLDELPQLINVLTGEMSLVGPRPQVAWAVELYHQDERALLDVRPGMTDVASIRFRNEAEILRGAADPDQAYLEKIAPEKHRLGLEYVRRQSIPLDLRIIFATLVAIIGRDPERMLGDFGGTDRSTLTPHPRPHESVAEHT
jgi:lipopolysaccharide/colanic/teichoic acid biosynthesis glycosyltransferase